VRHAQQGIHGASAPAATAIYTERTMKVSLVAVGLFVAVVSVASQSAVDLEQVGPQVGSRVPSFTLPDQTGRLRTLDSLMGPKGAILVFFRSADW
jgi:hypothetical protein